MLHSFISYRIPVQVPDIGASVKAAASVASSSVSSVAAAATSAGLGDIVKKYLFRSAGEERLAENVNASSEQMAQYKSAHQASGNVAQYHTEYQIVRCIDTNGQTFAIWLNVVYLAPLTVLFVRFFIKSYIRRTSGKGTKHTAAENAGKDGLKGVERQNGYTNGHANGHTNGSANGFANGKAKGKH
jgi:hypothetical protein